MIKIAITGNIASGKSEVEKYLKSLGFIVCDTDIISHKILETSDEIFNIFNKSEITTNSQIDRNKIANIVFNNRKKLKELEDIIHPLVKQEILKIFENYRNKDVVFISVPLLFKTNFDKLFDDIIFVSAEQNIQLERLMKRNNFSKEIALKRINAQIIETKDINKCKYLINNNSDIRNLYNQVDKIVQKILTKKNGTP